MGGGKSLYWTRYSDYVFFYVSLYYIPYIWKTMGRTTLETNIFSKSAAKRKCLFIWCTAFEWKNTVLWPVHSLRDFFNWCWKCRLSGLMEHILKLLSVAEITYVYTGLQGLDIKLYNFSESIQKNLILWNYLFFDVSSFYLKWTSRMYFVTTIAC